MTTNEETNQLTPAEIAADAICEVLTISVSKAMVAMATSLLGPIPCDRNAAPYMAYGLACQIWGWRFEKIEGILGESNLQASPDAAATMRKVEFIYRSILELAMSEAAKATEPGGWMSLGMLRRDETALETVMPMTQRVVEGARVELRKVLSQ